MAETIKKETVKEVTAEVPVIIYAAQEFAMSGMFDCPPECVLAAFKQNGSTEATQEEAKKMVKAFLIKEVN